MIGGYRRFRRRTITTKTTIAVTIMITSTSFGPINTAAMVILAPCLFFVFENSSLERDFPVILTKKQADILLERAFPGVLKKNWQKKIIYYIKTLTGTSYV